MDRLRVISSAAAGTRLSPPPLALRRVVDVQPEDVVGTIEGAVQRLQNKHLREGVWWIVVALQASQDTDQDSAVQHRLRVHRCDDSVQFLEGEPLKK